MALSGSPVTLTTTPDSYPSTPAPNGVQLKAADGNGSDKVYLNYVNGGTVSPSNAVMELGAGQGYTVPPHKITVAGGKPDLANLNLVAGTSTPKLFVDVL